MKSVYNFWEMAAVQGETSGKLNIPAVLSYRVKTNWARAGQTEIGGLDQMVSGVNT
jgi:hypothetical protein